MGAGQGSVLAAPTSAVPLCDPAHPPQAMPTLHLTPWPLLSEELLHPPGRLRIPLGHPGTFQDPPLGPHVEPSQGHPRTSDPPGPPPWSLLTTTPGTPHVGPPQRPCGTLSRTPQEIPGPPSTCLGPFRTSYPPGTPMVPPPQDSSRTSWDALGPSRTLPGSPGTLEGCSQTKRSTTLAGPGLPGAASGCPQDV